MLTVKARVICAVVFFVVMAGLVVGDCIYRGVDVCWWLAALVVLAFVSGLGFVMSAPAVVVVVDEVSQDYWQD